MVITTLQRQVQKYVQNEGSYHKLEQQSKRMAELEQQMQTLQTDYETL